MTVAQLIAVLQTVDPSLNVATHNGTSLHMFRTLRRSHGPAEIKLMNTYDGPYVSIGHMMPDDYDNGNYSVAGILADI